MVAMQDQQENETDGHEYWIKLQVYGAIMEVTSMVRFVPE